MPMMMMTTMMMMMIPLPSNKVVLDKNIHSTLISLMNKTGMTNLMTVIISFFLSANHRAHK